MSDRSQLERALVEASERIEWPTPDPHLPQRVAATVADRPIVRRRRLHPALITVVVIAAITATLVFSPAAREAVADVLRAAGIQIWFSEDPAPEVGAGLDLGTPVEVERAAEEADFTLRVPGIDPPGTPDAVYVDAGGAVTMAWSGADALPAAGDTGVALLLTQSTTGPDFAYKVLGPMADIQNRIVAEVPAIWIEGAPHTITLLDSEQEPVEMSTRLAANVLLWEAEGVGHRLETNAGFVTARAIAESLVPVP